MIRKCLIALAILSIFSGSVAHGDEAWGVTIATAYEWAKKYQDVNVYMKMVRWADIYVNYSILVVQKPEDNLDRRNGWLAGDFVGCTWIEVCNNFTDLMVEARFTWEDRVVAPEWYISMTESGYHGDRGSFGGPDPNVPPAPPATLNGWGPVNMGARVVVDNGIDGDGGTPPLDKATELNLTGNHGWVYLCMKLVGVDPQGAEFDPTDESTRAKIGTVNLTFFPALAPEIADFNGTEVGTIPAYYDDNVNFPDVNWNEYTGGIPGQNDPWPPAP